jgi:hypothetical protein
MKALKTVTAKKEESMTLVLPAPKMRARGIQQRGQVFKNRKAYDRKQTKRFNME